MGGGESRWVEVRVCSASAGYLIGRRLQHVFVFDECCELVLQLARHFGHGPYLSSRVGHTSVWVRERERE